MISLGAMAQAEYGKEYIKRIGEKSSTYVSRRANGNDEHRNTPDVWSP